eukprot:SAG31_NODE_5533_length_2471_cov_1.929595_1_plen_205_part_00
MLRKSCSARGLYEGGDAAALRDRLLKADLGLGLTEYDIRGPKDESTLESVVENNQIAPIASAVYHPQPGERCYSINCTNICDPSKECPHCKKNNMRTFFCSNVRAYIYQCLEKFRFHFSVHAQECFKSCWASHKKLHKMKPSDLELVRSWGLSRVMAADVLITMDLGQIAAVCHDRLSDALHVPNVNKNCALGNRYHLWRTRMN